MANYGLVTDVKKYGTGSLYAPYNTNVSKRVVINPTPGNNFAIGANEDFYISVWIKYGSLNVSQLGQQYPIIQYGNNTNGWSLGLRIQQTGDAYSSQPYFQFNDTRLTSDFNGANGQAISPSGGFDRYVVYRRSGIIYFQFNNGTPVNVYGYGPTSTYTQRTYTSSIGAGLPSGSTITLGSTQPVVTSAGAVNGAWIDELFFARGVSQVYNTYFNSAEIADGKLESTVFLYHFNGNYFDEVNGLETAYVNMSSSFSINANLVRKTGPEKRWAIELSSADPAYNFGSPWAVAVDSDTKTYQLVVRRQEGPPYSAPWDDPYLVKYDEKGVVLWARKINVTNLVSFIGNGLVVDSQGNVYGCIQAYEALDYPVSFDTISVFKITPDGTLAWTRSTGYAGKSDSAIDIAVDNSDNIYIGGLQRSLNALGTSQAGGYLAKITSAGVISYAKDIPYTYGISSIDVDGAGNAFVLGSSGPFGGQGSVQFDAWVGKFDSTGTIAWAYGIQTPFTTFDLQASSKSGITVDSTGSTYVAMRDFYTEQSGILKFNSVGALVWSKTLNASISKVITKQDGTLLGLTRDGTLFVFTPNGDIVWSNSISKDISVESFDIALTQTDDVLITGESLLSTSPTLDNTYGPTLVKLPSYNAKTGTYPNGWAYLPNNTLTLTNNDWVVVDAGLTAIQTRTSNVSVTISVSADTSYSTRLTDFSLVLGSAALTVSSTLTATGIDLNRASANLQARATLSKASAKKIVRTGATLQAQFNTSTVGKRTRRLSAAFVSTAIVTTVGKRLVTPSANLAVTTTQVSTVRKITNLAVTFTALASEVTLDTAVKSGKANLQSAFTVTADPIDVNTVVANLSSQSTASITVRATKSAVASFTSTATQDATARKRTDTVLRLEALASELVYGNYFVTSDSAHLSSSFTVECDPLKLAWNRTQLISESTFLADPIYTVQAHINLEAFASELTLGGKIRDPNPTELDSLFVLTAEPYDFTKAEAHLEAFAFEVVLGSKVSIDPYLMLSIDPETRLYKIYSEDRVFSIDSETRGLVIAPESRELEVKPENGLNIIQG